METRVCCFGNPIHGDDAVGLKVYERLQQAQQSNSKLGSLDLYFFGDVPLNAMNQLNGPARVLLVDAQLIDADDPSPVGEISCLGSSVLLESGKSIQQSLHFNSVPYVIHGASQLYGDRVAEMYLLTVAINTPLSYSTEMSSEVVSGCNQLAEIILNLVNQEDSTVSFSEVFKHCLAETSLNAKAIEKITKEKIDKRIVTPNDFVNGDTV